MLKQLKRTSYKLALSLLFVFSVMGLHMPANADDHMNAELEAHIAAQNDKFLSSFNKANAAAVTEMYAYDGKFIPNGSEAVMGKEAIESFMKGMFQGPKLNLALNSHNLIKDERTAVETGTWTMTIQPKDQPGLQETGNYTVVWEKQPSGDYLMKVDMINVIKPAEPVQ